MTIGIAASGPRAGEAIYKSVLATELMGRGAIGGFAVFAILDVDGKLHQIWTQRGGISTLHIPDAWFHASCAAIISSGPNRPEPLVQFLPGQDSVGMVTGHRLPNRPDVSFTVALNQRVLQLLAQGTRPQEAIDQVLGGNPEADAGLIAIGADGQIGAGNTQRVQRRTDLGAGAFSGEHYRYAFLHNSIFSAVPLHAVIQSVLHQTLAGNDPPADPSRYAFVELRCRIPVIASDRDAVVVDTDGCVERVETADPFVPSANQRLTLLYLNTPVIQQGRIVGSIASEMFAQVLAGVAIPSAVPFDNMAMLLRDTHDVAA